MARKRIPSRRASTKPPNDGTPLGHLSDSDLLAELARRRMAAGKLDLDSMEELVEHDKRDFGMERFAALVANLPPETDTPKPCPKCGRLVPVKARSRERRVLTLSGEVSFFRHYHHCDPCRHGFCPRDAELKLPEDGSLSRELERRILDFGVNDVFESAAQRFGVHYEMEISENLVRRVVERVGKLCEAAAPFQLQKAAMPMSEEPAPWLIVGDDGSMVCTRESAWKEAKLAVVARGPAPGEEPRPLQARYVSVVGGQDAFKEQLRAALAAERADEVVKVAWLGDGAHEIWTVANELCPLAVQILDLPHAVQHAMDCAKVLLGEQSPLLPLWEARVHQLLGAGVDPFVRELMECLPEATGEDSLAAMEALVRYYRTNEHRMRYREFREMGLPIGSGIVESAHKHVLQVRMKRAGQRWSLRRADRMARLRAAYRTAGPHRFHWAVTDAARRTRHRSM
jgi:hypothetical protein